MREKSGIEYLFSYLPTSSSRTWTSWGQEPNPAYHLLSYTSPWSSRSRHAVNPTSQWTRAQPRAVWGGLATGGAYVTKACWFPWSVLEACFLLDTPASQITCYNMLAIKSLEKRGMCAVISYVCSLKMVIQNYKFLNVSYHHIFKVKVKSFSRVRLIATPWAAAYQAPLSMGFSRQEYWSGVPLPSPFITESEQRQLTEH